MRTKTLVLLFALLLSANLRAQVTIGELADPTAGAILDLNKAVKGGLALSNVDLPDFHTIPATFPGMTPTPAPADMDAVKSGFRGALVYNTGVTTPPAGIYVWNGVNWTPVKENCTPLTAANLTLTGLPFAKAGDDVTFAVSSGASAFCSQGESYEWYKTGANDNNYTLVSETAPSLTTSFSSAGTCKVKVIVTNRYTATPLEKETTIEITADGAPPITLIDGQYAVNGDFCYDVKGPKPASQSVDYYNSRTDGFAGDAFTKTYTFTYTNDFSDLTALNPGGIVASVTQPAVTSGSGSGSVSFTVTFVPDVKTRVIANNGPVQVQLIVSFKNNSVVNKVVYKNIKVQDAICGCPAKISATQWLTFQCHNLGADYDIASDADLLGITSSNFREYHGDWYKFGAKNVSVVNDGTYEGSSIVPNWLENSYYPFQNDKADWITTNDPCPSGWRLPTNAEWAAVADINNNAQKHYVDGIVMTSTSDWKNGNINDVIKLGDYLYLPAAGYRHQTGAILNNRGYGGYYWSSMGTGVDYKGHFLDFYSGAPGMTFADRTNGMSVRCVLAE
jgi:uncharacterized protein (TIGR02145 family)